MFNFYKKRFLSFNISDYSIEMISLEGSLPFPKVKVSGRALLEKGIIEKSKILNKAKLKDSICGLIKNPDFGKIKTNKVIFSLPESKTLFCDFPLPPDLKKEELLAFIKKEAEQTFPYLKEEIFMDFKINNGKVFLFAFPQKMVNDFLEVFRSCELNPLIFEPESEAIARSLIKNRKENILIADIGAENTDLLLFSEGLLMLDISIESAGSSFTRSLSENLNVSLEKAEEIKKDFGLSPEKEQGKIFLILQKEAREIIDEIKKIENYFKNENNQSIEKIILTGGSALLPYFSEYLIENLQKSVIVGNPLESINVEDLPNREIFKMRSVIYSNVIGSALRGLERNPERAGINLVSDKESQKNYLEIFRQGVKKKFKFY